MNEFLHHLKGLWNKAYNSCRGSGTRSVPADVVLYLDMYQLNGFWIQACHS